MAIWKLFWKLDPKGCIYTQKKFIEILRSSGPLDHLLDAQMEVFYKFDRKYYK